MRITRDEYTGFIHGVNDAVAELPFTEAEEARLRELIREEIASLPERNDPAPNPAAPS